MKQLERLVVHVEEAVRLGLSDNEPELRLGLMLLDSAAELMMYRESDYVLRMKESIYGPSLRVADQVHEHTGQGADEVARIKAELVSKTRRRRIYHEFDAKCDFLVEQGTLPRPHSRALRKLHEYRNETHHRDEVRSATLASATRIYAFLVCTMMSTMPVHSIGITDEPPAAIRKYIRSGESGFGAALELQARIGRELLRATGIAEPMDLGAALSDHVANRLDELEDALGECVSFFNAMNDRGWDADAILGFIQAPKPDDPYDHLRRTVLDFRQWAKPVSAAELRAWRREGEDLAGQVDDLQAFTTFADIEDAFEPIERKALDLALDVDREIQHQIDAYRGK